MDLGLVLDFVRDVLILEGHMSRRSLIRVVLSPRLKLKLTKPVSPGKRRSDLNAEYSIKTIPYADVLVC